ncbi:transcription-repair coupling factor [Sandarakinorhabdus sp.]|uniref:transcription-repair coupling factor n=1 Tax=Sandarakinorhabdus sp. TaxID=1916663 RepID=UPI00286D7990|nr:transcription-repair coupling factor [Sandarakinorhabdus sp.]
MIDLRNFVTARRPLTLARCAGGFLPWLMADAARAAKGRAVFIAADEAQARSLADAAQFFAPELSVIMLPAWDCLPYDRASPSLRVAAERLAALAALGEAPTGAQLLVTTVNAMTQRTLPAARIAALTAIIRPGTRIDRDQLAAKLASNGYVRADTVVEPGEYALRGSLLDLMPAGADAGLRLDFFGDEVETLRRFDPATQRSLGSADGFTLLPVSEVLIDEARIKAFRAGYLSMFGSVATADPVYEAVSDGRRLAGMEHWLPLFEPELTTMFDWLGADDVIVRDSGADLAASDRFDAIADYHDNRTAALSQKKGSYRPLPADALYLDRAEWAGLLASRSVHVASLHSVADGTLAAIDCDAVPARDFAPERVAQANNGPPVYTAIRAHIEGRRSAGDRVILASYSHGARERLMGLLVDEGVDRLGLADSWQEALGVAARGSIALTVVPLEHGFTRIEAKSAILVLTEQDMLGDRLVRKKRSARKADAFMSELAALSPGDLIVHRDHGIGRYDGLVAIEIARRPHDCVMLSYDGGDKLYVPVENLDVLSRYGSDSDGVGLDKLGGVAWSTRKARMKQRIREIAGELLKTAAERALRQGEPAVVDPHDYAAFVDRFPYAETDDQLRAIADVLEDLSSGKPMDRLVCGDVGFGKTEVALRAAFAAAMSGMQVAIVCPTTLLARQHFAGFQERFAGMPIRVRHLSRLVSAADAKLAREGIEDGTVDIVVGTHAILAKSVEFKRLGLVVIDEEQRFGVVHKERLKALKADVHVLTLTATPIPRTLQMALTGLREMSIIATPPVDRLAVRTYVMPFDEVVLREALLREHYRGGQSFFVVPRIADLADIEEFIRREVPEIKPITAHGQMAPSEVEERMSAFYDKRHDVLLSTTIIESGLDIPSANTLIVHRADRFGLAQLYQIRGRVGRAKTRAYAYLTTPAGQVVSETAQKRLQVLSQLDTLGAGFQLASHDLDQRGAGNLLGDEQSGHIKEIGFELYQSMLEDAILEAQAHARGVKPPEEAFSPQITAEVPILIPEDYVPDLNVRMALYRRLNEMTSRPDIDGFAAEMIDRFGKLPIEAANLLAIIEIKLACLGAGIAKLEAGPKGGLVTFQGDSFANPEGLFAYIDRLGARAKIRPDNKLFVAAEWAGDQVRLKGALALASSLAKIAGGAAVGPGKAAPEAKGKPLPPKTATPSKPPPKVPIRPSVFRSKMRG